MNIFCKRGETYTSFDVSDLDPAGHVTTIKPCPDCQNPIHLERRQENNFLISLGTKNGQKIAETLEHKTSATTQVGIDDYIFLCACACATKPVKE